MTRDELRAIDGLTDEQINAIMRLHGRDETTHRSTLDNLREQLTTAQNGLAAFNGVNVAEMRTQIADLQQRLTQQAADFAFSTALNDAARAAGAHSVDDVSALLPNRDALRTSKDLTADLTAALATLKQSKPYLFSTAPALAPAPAPEHPEDPPIVAPQPRPQQGKTDPTIEEFLRMTGAERMQLRARNPALFQQLSAQLRAMPKY